MQAFSRSSNIYFARAVGNLSSHELYRDLVDFGFGQPTASQYPGQAAGLLAAPATWSGRSKPTIAIGQEVAVTPLQLGLAVCAVANDGVLYAPRLYDEIRDERGRVMQEVPPAPLRRVMARPLATLLREAMRRVVVEGTGQGAKLDWISAAGKTGTAQKCRDGRGYAPGAYMACFAGMVPAEQPELVILTVLDEPDSRRHYASQSAVPMFAAIVREIRRSTDWLTRSPGSQTHVLNRSDGETCVVPDVLHLNADGARRRIVAAGLQVAGAEKDGIVVQQIPAAGTICAAGQNVTLTVAGSRDPVAETAPICPDFVGLSNRQVHSLAARLGLPVELAGVGYVVAQQPAPGTQLAVGPVHLELEGPWH